MINQIDLQQIMITSTVITIGVIGLVQFVKNFVKNKKGKKVSIISAFLTAIICILNSSLVPVVVTILVDLFVMSLAISQLAWDILAQAIPKAIQKLLEQGLHLEPNSLNTDNKEGENKC